MAYDEDLAVRIRDVLVSEDVVEKKMFGGLAFLVHGHMAVAAASSGSLMVRVDPDDGARLTADGKAEPMVMQNRPLKGWLLVGTDELRTKRQLTTWVGRGVAYVKSLPPK